MWSPTGCPELSCGAVLGYFQLWLLETFSAFATFSPGGSVTAPGRAGAAAHFLEKTLKCCRVSEETPTKEKNNNQKNKTWSFSNQATVLLYFS